MKCPICRNKTRVIDTQRNPGLTLWRKRECLECLTRFKTYEVIEHKSMSDFVLSKTKGNFEAEEMLK